jgi:GNAT-family acetyltransferase (TIGR03103 family)
MTDRIRHRVDRQGAPTLRSHDVPARPRGERMTQNASIDCGWGRLIFAHTFDDNEKLAEAICDESSGKRNIALYIKDPQVVLALRPQQLFLDPSHTYRLWFHNYPGARIQPRAFAIRRMQDRRDAKAVSQLLSSRGMVPPEPEFLSERIASRELTHFVAVDTSSSRIIGCVMGVDHKRAFDDIENGSSLWALAVDSRAGLPGVGRALAAYLADHYCARGRDYVDLSVMHDNEAVIKLYEEMGFQRIPAFCIKRKNAINEPLYTAPEVTESRLNPYARIIVDEARRRGIGVDMIDPENGYFALRFGTRSIVCRESLTELTSAVAMSRCDDKRVTLRLMRDAGIRTAPSVTAETPEACRRFLREHGTVVVKPVRGEQGKGVHVGIDDAEELDAAVRDAGGYCADVLVEACIDGTDLRVIVIDGDVVAAAVRRPAEVTGNGRDSVATLIAKTSRRRAAATGGESRIPLDGETDRILKKAGLDRNSVLEEGRRLQVRETANLHTGGTLHDVTSALHPEIARASEQVARTLNIPVVGLDFIIDAPDQPRYCFIEANERPGLANHEPQPTVERFIDFLFPQTAIPT